MALPQQCPPRPRPRPLPQASRAQRPLPLVVVLRLRRQVQQPSPQVAPERAVLGRAAARLPGAAVRRAWCPRIARLRPSEPVRRVQRRAARLLWARMRPLPMRRRAQPRARRQLRVRSRATVGAALRQLSPRARRQHRLAPCTRVATVPNKRQQTVARALPNVPQHLQRGPSSQGWQSSVWTMLDRLCLTLRSSPQSGASQCGATLLL